MPVDEFHLRNTARELAGLYRQLHGLKHTHPTPPEVRVMKPAPGPQTPGNWLYVSLYIDQEQKLREVAFNAFADLGVKLRDDDASAPRLCELIAYHAQPISELDWAEDLADELDGQSRTIRQRCRPHDCEQSSEKAWLTARTICYRLRKLDLDISPDLLRKWAEREKIDVRVLPDGKKAYLFQQVLSVISQGENSAQMTTNLPDM